MRPTISVVTPCLNAEETLGRTLESVRSQTFPAHEHVVVDGGSSDGTLDLLRSSAGVRWISEPDRGLSHAYNKGVAMATGDVVGWLNADDFYFPQALEHVAKAFEANPDTIWAVGRCAIVDADDREIRRPIAAYKDALLRRYSYATLLANNYVPAPSTFVTRRAFLDAGGLDERFGYAMDYDLWLRLGRIAPPVVLNERLAAFRMAEGSLSMSGFEKQFREHEEIARAHGAGHGAMVAVNRLTSRAIPGTYRVMRRLRGGDPSRNARS